MYKGLEKDLFLVEVEILLIFHNSASIFYNPQMFQSL